MQACISLLLDEVVRFQLNLPIIFREDFSSKNIKYKRCGMHHLVLLYIPNTVFTNESRYVDDARFAKFRAQKAWCVAVIDTYACETKTSYLHLSNYGSIVYTINDWVYPNGWERDPQIVCAPGIHFFNHWLPAYYYLYQRYDELVVHISDDGKIEAVRLPNDTRWISTRIDMQKHIQNILGLDISQSWERHTIPNV